LANIIAAIIIDKFA